MCRMFLFHKIYNAHVNTGHRKYMYLKYLISNEILNILTALIGETLIKHSYLEHFLA